MKKKGAERPSLSPAFCYASRSSGRGRESLTTFCVAFGFVLGPHFGEHLWIDAKEPRCQRLETWQ